MSGDTLNIVACEAFAIADSKGWWEHAKRPAVDGDVPCREGLTLSPVEVVAQLALIMSECAEAIECVRDRDYLPRMGPDKATGALIKPEGLPSEIADVVIRAAQLAHALAIDLDLAVGVKSSYNAVRQHRHGGRAL